MNDTILNLMSQIDSLKAELEQAKKECSLVIEQRNAEVEATVMAELERDHWKRQTSWFSSALQQARIGLSSLQKAVETGQEGGETRGYDDEDLNRERVLVRLAAVRTQLAQANAMIDEDNKRLEEALTTDRELKRLKQAFYDYYDACIRGGKSND